MLIENIVCVCSYQPGPQGVCGWHGGGFSAGFGNASGENGEDDAGGGCDLPHSYQLSSSFCSESAKKGH